MIIPDGLVEKSLLLGSPDLSALHALLTESHGLSHEQAQTAVYEAILQVNTAVFPPITKMELLLTEGCNLACAYCFEKGMPRYRRMPHDIAQAAVDLLFDYAHKADQLHITHFGGEPFLNFDAVRFATEYAQEKAASLGKSITFGITSNGTLLTRPVVHYCAQHGIKVLLSVDGLEATHDKYRVDKRGQGTFKKVMQGMRMLKRVQPWIGVRMTVMPESAEDLFENVLGLYAMGVNQFVIASATGVKWDDEEIEVFCRQFRRLREWCKKGDRKDLRIYHFEETDQQGSFFGCQAGRNSISVCPNGEISPCSKVLALNNTHLLAKLGDVTHGLAHVLNRLELVSCAQMRAACEAKGIAEDFRGGCFAANYDENKDLFQPSIQSHVFDKARRMICSEGA